MISSSLRSSSPPRSFAVRLGHDLIWLLIAVLFCAVECVVFVTQFLPAKQTRPRREPLVTTAPDFAAERLSRVATS